MLKIYGYAILFSIFLFSAPALANWQFLERDIIFDNPIASPRSPGLGFSIDSSEHQGKQILYTTAALGGHMGIVGHHSNRLSIQLGIEAGGWFTFNRHEGMSFALLTEDFLISFPISLRFGKLSTSFKWSHISAHLGDGMAKFTDPEPAQPIIYSRDFLTVAASRTFTVKGENVKPYIQVEYVYRIFPEGLKQWTGSAGVEISSLGDCAMFSAFDVRLDQATESVNISSKLGWFKRPDERFGGLRVFVGAYVGNDVRGQLYDEKIRKIGIGMELN